MERFKNAVGALRNRFPLDETEAATQTLTAYLCEWSSNIMTVSLLRCKANVTHSRNCELEIVLVPLPNFNKLESHEERVIATSTVHRAKQYTI